MSARPAFLADGWPGNARGRNWCSSRTREVPSLERFYKNHRKAGALPAQRSSFLFQRAQRLAALKQQDLFAPRRAGGLSPFEKDRLFAWGSRWTAAEMSLYEQVASRLAVDPPDLDRGLPGALGDPPSTDCHARNLLMRAVPGAAYLTRLNDAYARFFHGLDKRAFAHRERVQHRPSARTRRITTSWWGPFVT